MVAGRIPSPGRGHMQKQPIDISHIGVSPSPPSFHSLKIHGKYPRVRLTTNQKASRAIPSNTSPGVRCGGTNMQVAVVTDAALPGPWGGGGDPGVLWFREAQMTSVQGSVPAGHLRVTSILIVSGNTTKAPGLARPKAGPSSALLGAPRRCRPGRPRPRARASLGYVCVSKERFSTFFTPWHRN